MLTNTNNLLMVLKRMPKIFIVNIFAKTHTNKKNLKKNQHSSPAIILNRDFQTCFNNWDYNYKHQDTDAND